MNGGQDFSILAMTYAVFTSAGDTGAGVYPIEAANAVPHYGPLAVHNSAVVLHTGAADGAGDTTQFLFDFDWNFRTKTGMPYMTAGGVVGGAPNADLLPRVALGFSEQGDMLRFNRPQVVKAGESLMFATKPTLWAPVFGTESMSAIASYQTRVTVNLVCIGYQDGRMAWPTLRK